MKFIRLLKASKWSVEKINENDWTIKSPDGMYKDENGKQYHFKTKEDALEELDYLRAEHKFDKKSSKKVISKIIQVDVYNIDWEWDDTEDEDLIEIKSLPNYHNKLNVEVEDKNNDDEIYENIAYELKNEYGYTPRYYDYTVVKNKFDKKSNSEDYDLAYNTLEECLSNGLITDPDTNFEDVEFELIEQAGLNPDEMDDVEYNYWKDLFLEAWKEVDWNY